MGHDHDVGSSNAGPQHPRGTLSFERDMAERRVTVCRSIYYILEYAQLLEEAGQV
jgi:hypothetical protein